VRNALGGIKGTPLENEPDYSYSYREAGVGDALATAVEAVV